jgi:tetratricopeptide (TPR) repeat protein
MDEEALSDLGFQVSDGLGLDEDDSLPLLGFEDEKEDLPEAVIEGGPEIEQEPVLEEEGAESFDEEVDEEVEVEEVEVEDAAFSALPGSHEDAADQGDMELAIQRVRIVIEEEPENVPLHQRLVEYAFRTNDQDVLISAYLQLAGCLARTDAPLKAKAVYQQVLALSPDHEGATSGIQGLDAISGGPPAEVASSEEYVDLGSMILGDDAEDTTRWTVAAEAPSGDDEADFAKMLGQFKDKVSEHVAADDVSAHHDLGTAYMEMGLFEEAIGEYQMALRASPTHLPTHEVMGRCWMEMEKPDMAVRALNRALNVPFEVEDELIGIYYLMGRAQEDQGNNEEALEFYEKVFSLDINFEDVTERLRALR